MKNFPHQISNLDRLNDVFRVFAELIEDGADVSDDGIVGVALARSGGYTFSNRALSIEEALAIEAQKAPANQGTRTAAREFRRMFFLLGFLQEEEGTISLSEAGSNLLGSRQAGSIEEANSIWRRQLNQLELVDDEGNSSHPYALMKAIVRSRPGIQKRFLALAFEPQDDSEEEFERILEHIDRNDFEQTLADLGVSRTSADNAVKILPPLGEQLGEIIRQEDQCFLPTIPEELRVTLMQEVELVTRFPVHPRELHNSVSADQIASLLAGQPRLELDAEERLETLENAIELTRERSNRHQLLIRRFAQICERNGYLLYENPYDCLAVRQQDGLLVEGKTLNAGRIDQRKQVLRALAQLKYYRRFEIGGLVDEPQDLICIALFESELDFDFRQFLSSEGIHPVWANREQFHASDETKQLLTSAGIRI